MNVNLLSTWIYLPIYFLYILFIYIYLGVESVTRMLKEMKGSVERDERDTESGEREWTEKEKRELGIG